MNYLLVVRAKTRHCIVELRLSLVVFLPDLNSIGLAQIVALSGRDACSLRDPKGLEIVGSDERKHEDKTYRVIFGKIQSLIVPHR